MGAVSAGEVDTRGTLDLGDDGTFGTIDDELTATDTDGHIADVHVLFEDFLHFFSFNADVELQTTLEGLTKIATFRLRRAAEG